MKRSRSSFSCAECMHCLAAPAHWAGIVQWLLYWLPRIKTGARNFIQEPCGHIVTSYNTLAVAQSAPDTDSDGWSLLMVNVNFCVGLRVTFLLSSPRQRSHCQAKLNFLTKDEAVVSDEPGPGRGWLVGAGLAPPGNPWQRKLTILLYTSRCHDMGLGSVIIPQTQLALKCFEHK